MFNRNSLAAWLLVWLVGCLATPAYLAAEEEVGRNKVRLLLSFETPADLAAVCTEGENLDASLSADNGVTDGANCARMTFAKAKDSYGVFTLGPEAIKNWSDFDYFGMDVYAEEELSLCFELWDQDSKNYATRCSNEYVKINPGKNNLLIAINRAKRNNKEGMEWHELEAKDKIAMDRLKRVKIFMPTAADRPKVMWIDNLRLLQEDAAKPKLKIDLPPSALAFDFGGPGAVCPGFQGVSAAMKAGGEKNFGLTDTNGVREGGEGWPDLLTGTFLIGDTIGFRAAVPNGKYKVWLSAGKVLDEKYHGDYTLKINDKVLCSEQPSQAEYYGEKYYFRFLRTQFSLKPHALWLNYIAAMYPAETFDLEVADGQVYLQARNHFVGGLILVPEKDAAVFDKMRDEIQSKRIASFEKTFFAKPAPAPEKMAGDKDYVLWQPGSELASTGKQSKKLPNVGPFTFPSAEDRKKSGLTGAGALGQHVVLNLAVVPFQDLGRCTLELTDLTGPGTIAASGIRGFFQNYRSNGEKMSEMGVVPGLTLNCEANLTQCLWLWFQVPADAKPGKYSATFTFKPTQGQPQSVPVQFEVYPFALEPKLPYSFGMYGWAPDLPHLTGEAKVARDRAVHAWARAIGFTARSVRCATATGVADGDVNMSFDSSEIDMAREAGFHATPEQQMMVNSLGIGRAISRKILLKAPDQKAAPVDANPGIEFTSPNYEALWKKAMAKYKAFLDKQAVPYACESVDEPRETPNPWNRNLEHTNRYGDWLKEVGIYSFVTPMGDKQSGLDYTSLVDHHDVVSVHAGRVSMKMVEQTLAKGKTLWFYNTGMDRFSWGFFNWRTGSKGRWEWHFCDAGNGGTGGYPGNEWYNPFTERQGFATLAPLSATPEGILWQTSYFQVCEGINDSAYLVTLEKAIAANKATGTNAATVKAAEDFLAALKKAIPMTPGVAGIADESAGALVGKGAEDDAMYMAGEWRAKIAEFLTVLKK